MASNLSESQVSIHKCGVPATHHARYISSSLSTIQTFVSTRIFKELSHTNTQAIPPWPYTIQVHLGEFKYRALLHCHQNRKKHFDIKCELVPGKIIPGPLLRKSRRGKYFTTRMGGKLTWYLLGELKVYYLSLSTTLVRYGTVALNRYLLFSQSDYYYYCSSNNKKMGAAV
jgi:hypothetical protein